MLIAGAFPVVAGEIDINSLLRQVQANAAPAPEGKLTQPAIDCTCRYGGDDFMLGQEVCIRSRMARCDRVLNNTSWKISNDFCPVAMSPVQITGG